MNKLELIVFRVGFGLSVALIEHPTNYLTLIDLGSASGFTPLKYLALKRKLRPDILYITHPHADHISDVDTALNSAFTPDAIHCQTYDWSDVASREKPTCRWMIQNFKQLVAKMPAGNYRGKADLACWRITPGVARKRFGDQRYVNASSLFIIYTWRDFKIAIAGDHETDILDQFLQHKKFVAAAKGTDILIAAHHGHKNGFSQLWTSSVGKPHISLISVQSRDPHVDGRYSKPEFAKGVRVDGATRYALTTRTDGNLFVNMSYRDGQAQWDFQRASSL